MLVEYLRRAAWPRSLVIDYGEPLAYTLGDVLPQAIAVVALLAVTVWAVVRQPAAGFLLACFFVILAPTSSVIPIATEVGAERRMYLPLAAAVTLVVLAARSLPRRWIVTAALLSAVPLGAATIERNREYGDGLTLWQSTLERWPSARAHRNVATELKRAGRAPEAIAHLREATKGHPEARYALGYELYEQRRYAEAAQELRQFIRDYPADTNVVTAHLLTADALRAEDDFAAAVEHYDAVARARPADARVWVGLGFALASSGQLPRAETALARAVAADPRSSVARMTLGLVVAAQPGRLTEAAHHLRTAVALDPSSAEAREHLAKVEALSR
jgi:tetratricopeptide (TPR) repeat protein